MDRNNMTLSHTYLRLTATGFAFLSFMFLTACVNSQQPNASPTIIEQAQPQIPKKFLYQYTLRPTSEQSGKDVVDEAGNQSQVLAHTPYFLKILNYPLSNTPQESFNGVTDSNGKTMTILADREIDMKDVQLVERYGEGEFGKFFSVQNQDEEPIRNMSYSLKMSCPNAKTITINGSTNDRGFTKYAASKQECDLRLFVGNHELKYRKDSK